MSFDASRRRWFLGATALAASKFVGCIASGSDLRAIDIDKLGSERVLLVGRLHIFLGREVTAGSLIEIESSLSSGYQLERGGEVIWQVKRRERDLRITFVTGAPLPGAIAMWGAGPLLAPANVPEPIVYFGDVEIDLSAFGSGKEEFRRPNPIPRRDDAAAHLRSVAARLPRLRERAYYNLIKRRVEHVPS